MYRNLRALLVCGALALLLPACQDQQQPDYRPFGDGLRAIGICMVVSTVVSALAALIESDRKKRDQPCHPDQPEDPS